MKFEEINTNTENAISVIRAEVENGLLKRVLDCWSFLSGYTKDRPVMIYPIWQALHSLVDEGKISY